ncbi:MAG: cytochrome c biogenesis protein CcsA [Acidobacteriota bacterium]
MLRSAPMETFLSVGVVLLPLAYLVVVAAYGFLFFSGAANERRWATPALLGTLAFHLLYLVVLAYRWHQFPAATVAQALSIIAFSIAGVYALVEWLGRDRSTGFWLVGLVFFFQLFSSLLGRPVPPDLARFKIGVIAIHISLALLGYTAFAIAAGYAFLFLQLYRDLKGGRFSTFFGKLPPLEALERMMLGALVTGFVCLSGAVFTGILFAQREFPAVWHHDPKIIATAAIWLLYGVALALHRLRRWQGKQTAIVALTGLGAILFSLFAVNFFFTDFHGFL